MALGSWLTYGTAAEQKAADACIAKAFESGINFFDTANAYNRGEGEKAMGAALKVLSEIKLCALDEGLFPDGRWPE